MNAEVRNSKGKKYYKEIEIIRAIAVVCVVLGHSFPDFENGMSHTWAIFLSRFCYCFHMGLFFLVSGFLSSNNFYSSNLDIASEIRKKFNRLLIPYFIYSIITYGLKVILGNFANHPANINDLLKMFIGISPNGGLWFLWTLFVIDIAILLYSKFSKNGYILVFICLVLHILGTLNDTLLVTNTLKFSIFFALGVVLNKHYDYVKKHINNLPYIIISFAVVIGAAVLQTVGVIGEQFYLFSAIAGCIMIWGVVVSNLDYLSKFDCISNFSVYSYDIYLLSYFPQMFIRTLFDRIFNLNYMICVFGMFFFGLLVPIVISKYFLRRNGYLRKYFLGIH